MSLRLTSRAEARVLEYLQRRGSGVGLRVGVTETCCPGYSYGLASADAVGRGGVVRDDGVRQGVARRIQEMAQQLGFGCLGLFDSPVQGKKGNREIFLDLRWTVAGSASSRDPTPCPSRKAWMKR